MIDLTSKFALDLESHILALKKKDAKKSEDHINLLKGLIQLAGEYPLIDCEKSRIIGKIVTEIHIQHVSTIIDDVPLAFDIRLEEDEITIFHKSGHRHADYEDAIKSIREQLESPVIKVTHKRRKQVDGSRESHMSFIKNPLKWIKKKLYHLQTEKEIIEVKWK